MEIKTEGRNKEELLNNSLELLHSDLCHNSGWKAAGMDALQQSMQCFKLPVFIMVPK